jgi:hypothetical protein
MGSNRIRYSGKSKLDVQQLFQWLPSRVSTIENPATRLVHRDRRTGFGKARTGRSVGTSRRDGLP